jgi:hypothetical protein
MSTRNLLSIYKKSTFCALQNGVKWYEQANNYACELANKYGLPVEKSAGIISALSPMITWEQNKRDAEVLIQGLTLGIDTSEQYKVHRFSTYSKNVIKGEQIFYSDQPVVNFFSDKTGPKTLSFFLNILRPTEQTRVTIDRHAIAAWQGVKDGTGGSRRVTTAQYKKIESDYVSVANKVNLLPHQLQAIIWVTYKQLNNL